jgi:hypothetical protein
MQGIADAIKYLYQQWILRDIVAYVTPGTILGACLLKILLNGESVVALARGIPAIAYVPLYGLLFSIGVAVQNFGEVIKVLKEYRKSVDHQKHEHEWLRFRDLLRLHCVACNEDEYGEELERTRERIEVKKYMSGNIALATVISLILISIAWKFPKAGPWAAVVVVLVLIASLLRTQRTELRYLTIWQHEALKDCVALKAKARPAEPSGTSSTIKSMAD